MDVKTAYLYGKLKEEIYMAQPEGFIKSGQEHKVCKLVKSIYGLKQAGRVWYETISKTLQKKLGFQQLHSDAPEECTHFANEKGTMRSSSFSTLMIYS